VIKISFIAIKQYGENTLAMLLNPANMGKLTTIPIVFTKIAKKFDCIYVQGY
jgi:hypothetical protein